MALRGAWAGLSIPFVKGMAGYPELIEVKKLEHGGRTSALVALGHRLPGDSADGLDAGSRARFPLTGDTLFANPYLCP